MWTLTPELHLGTGQAALETWPSAAVPLLQKQGWNQNPQTVVNTCDLRDNVRVVCGHPHISAQECEALNCCFDGHRCYYGKAVTLHCTKSGEFIIVVAKDVTVPLLDLETISLLGQGQGCSHIDSNSNFAIYQFPVTSCGTVVMEDSGSGSLIYENKMISSYEVGISRLGAITRDSQFELVVQCRYHPFLTSTSVQALIFDEVRESIHWHVNGTGSVSVELMLANGECTAKGCNDFEEAYTSFYTEYPVTKALREPVFVAVRLLGMHPTVHLTLGRCWATYGSSPHSLPQWDILINGCPYQDDRYLSKLIRIDSNSGLNFPNHHKRFMFQMFSFVNPQTLTHICVFRHKATPVSHPAPEIVIETVRDTFIVSLLYEFVIFFLISNVVCMSLQGEMLMLWPRKTLLAGWLLLDL
uniref:Zona pellucida sperm-binding protein 4 n=1 Tax=Sphaeramia orbicularis TaxID=375764 RepID=A0A672YUA1_9TELE